MNNPFLLITINIKTMQSVGFVLNSDEWATLLLEIGGTDVSNAGITPENLPASTTYTGWTKQQNDEGDYVLCIDVEDTISISLDGIGTAEAEPFFGGRPPITRPHWS